MPKQEGVVIAPCASPDNHEFNSTVF